jgi:2-polyprenyl-3-methyl-5-hydroxy-6-metoxy-1,4-benzoquinol methylase
MKIYYEELSDVVRYIERNRHKPLEEDEPKYNTYLHYINRFKAVGRESKILEIGTGTGWFPILCEKNGISCKGLEISPQLIEHARSIGQKYCIEPDIQLGNIEEADIGVSEYDVIIAKSVFEHVEYWQNGIKKIFDALKPGGLFYFSSTNKFSLISDEYNFPLYGWLPNRWRYKLRTYRQGEDIMKLGIDFNQFTYFQLTTFFKQLGFSIVMNKIEFIDPENLNKPKLWKKIFLKTLKRVKPLKNLVLLFDRGTSFMCLK